MTVLTLLLAASQALAQAAQPLGAPSAPASTWDLAKDFQLPIALIVIALIACGSGIFVFLGYRNLAARRIALLEAKDAREEADLRHQQEVSLRQQLSSTGATSVGNDADKDDTEEPAESGFDRLRLLVRDAPDRVASLVKQWTRNPVGAAKDALATIPQMLKTEELMQVFKHLNVEDRREWRKYLGTNVSPVLKRRVDAFLTSQIIENLLVPAPLEDAEFRDLFDQLKVTEAIEIANEDPELGAVLISVLPSVLAARVFSQLSAERASQITTTSIELTDREIQRKVSRLKQALKAVRERHHVLPFSSRAIELLKDAGPEQEAAIFNALSEAGDHSTLESAARQFFPAELISRLPVKILRDCMEALSIEKRAELILSRGHEERNWLLMALGKPGTKAREFIDLELKQLETDQTRVRRAERNRDFLWKQFTETCRAMIRNNPHTAELAETLLSDWIALKTDGATGAMGGPNAA
jgi:flagellar motor switch protein FliG